MRTITNVTLIVSHGTLDEVLRYGIKYPDH
jgi:hypothetical protein